MNHNFALNSVYLHYPKGYGTSGYRSVNLGLKKKSSSILVNSRSFSKMQKVSESGCWFSHFGDDVAMVVFVGSPFSLSRARARALPLVETLTPSASTRSQREAFSHFLISHTKCQVQFEKCVFFLLRIEIFLQQSEEKVLAPISYLNYFARRLLKPYLKF